MLTKEVRVFLSSPGDVAEERDRARRVIEGLEKQYPGVALTPVLWEDLALPVTASFQEGIDCVLNERPIDLAVFILWSRLGTPVRLSGKEYRSGTEREFDLMLAAFERSGGKRPIILAYTRGDDAGFRQKLVSAPDGSLEELLAQRKLAEQFIREHFLDAQGRNLRAYHTYSGPIEFADRLRAHLRRALDDLRGGDAQPRWHGNPFRYLDQFDVQDAFIFFGRDEETCDVLKRLRDQQQAGASFVAIVGASGSGKSSLARAGVAASLLQHPEDADVKHWRLVSFEPAREAGDLIHGLSRSLAAAIPELNDTPRALADLEAGLKRDPALTVRLCVEPALARAGERAGGKVRVLLLVDQMEELWTAGQKIGDAERSALLEAVEALAGGGGTSVLVTLRSDFYSEAQQMPAFVRLKGQRGHFDLLPPDAAALRRMIAEPARLAGLNFERHERTGRTLDEVILQDASRDPSSLPLVQYALSELYRQCVPEAAAADDAPAGDSKARPLLTFAVYEGMGGVEGALARRADEVFGELPVDEQAALEEILPLLVTVEAGRGPTAARGVEHADEAAGEHPAARRRAPLAELTATPARKALTEKLIAARFLASDGAEGVPMAALAHDALLRRWQRAANWIAENREQLRLRARVEQNERLWELRNRDENLLLPPGLPLEEGRQLLHGGRRLLGETTAEYIALSMSREERRARRRKLALAGLSVLTLAFACLATFAGWQWKRAVAADRKVIAGLVERLRTTDDGSLPGVLVSLAPYGEKLAVELRPLAWQPDDPQLQLRARLGLLAMGDRTQAAEMQRLFFSAGPKMSLVLREQLQPYSAEWAPALWARLEDQRADGGERLRAACALSEFDAASQAWEAAAPEVARLLATGKTAELRVWMEALAPVGEKLVPSLLAAFADRQAEPIVRANAMTALAEYASPRDLAAAIVEAREDELRALVDVARQRDRQLTIELLTSITRIKLADSGAVPLAASEPAVGRDGFVAPVANVGQDERPGEVKLAAFDADAGPAEQPLDVAAAEHRRTADARRLANAAAGLLLLEQDGPAWEVLHASPNPTARSYLILLCAKVKVSPQLLAQRLRKENSVSARRALIHCLGNYASAELPPAVVEQTVELLRQVYRQARDAGARAAAEWTLRQWGLDQEIADIDRQLASDSPATAPAAGSEESAGWFVNCRGQPFVTLSPRKFRMGSPLDEFGRNQGDDEYSEELKDASLDYPFAIAVKEVTNREFAEFLEAHPEAEPPKDSDKYSPDVLGPRPGVSWLAAAKYCRWLSEQEGIAENQQCFPPLSEIGEEIKLPGDWLKRTGYRLPTEREWECACRAGTTTARYFGEGTELLAEYGWYVGNNKAPRASVGGMKKANEFGIFDLYGNGFEWCMDGLAPEFDDRQREIVKAGSKRFARGGGMSSPANEVRSAHRTSFAASRAGFTCVFRLARTLPAAE